MIIRLGVCVKISKELIINLNPSLSILVLSLIREKNHIFSFDISKYYNSLNFRLLFIEKDKHQ